MAEVAADVAMEAAATVEAAATMEEAMAATMEEAVATTLGVATLREEGVDVATSPPARSAMYTVMMLSGATCVSITRSSPRPRTAPPTSPTPTTTSVIRTGTWIQAQLIT